MPEPQIHDPAKILEQTARFNMKAPQEEPKRWITDPLRNFCEKDRRLETEMHAWMTFSKEDRAKRLKFYADRPLDSQWTEEDRRSTFEYVMYAERRHKLGDREVAAYAFNCIWPKDQK